jgi:TolB-like protein
MSENDGSSKPQGEVSPSTEAALDPDSVRDVFVSYASQDVVVANAVVVALERVQITCWIAPRDVVPGALYADGIIRAITGSKVFVLVLSQNAIASKHVGKEVERASSKGRPIVTLRTDAAPLTPALEYFLSESQWIDVDAARPEKAVTQVVNAVRRHMAGEHPIDPRVASNTAHTPKSAGSGNRVGMQRAWRPSMAAVALAVVLVLAAAYIVIERFGGFTNNIADKPVAATAPAVQNALPAVVISEKSVAVLPFVDMSEKKDQEYFSDGLSEELIDMLTKVSDLRVPARTSSFYFKGKQATIADIAKALGVANVLEGSVRKSGNTIRITAQLIRVDSGYHLWSETYDRKLDDIFKIQDEIATRVVDALQISLKGGALPSSVGTQSVKAYNLFQQGHHIAQMASNDAQNETALDLIQQAITADPAFAIAWATKSQVLDDLRRGPEARHAAEEALRLNPSLPESHTALARVMIVDDSDLRGAEKHLELAIELDPNNSWALSWMGQIAGFKGDFDKGIKIFKTIIARDPVDTERYKGLSFVYFLAGQYEAALAADRRARELTPSWPGQHFFAAQILMAKGNAAGALAELDLENDQRLRDGCGCRVLMYDALGRKSEADAALAKLEKTKANEEGYEIARVYADRGQLDLAFKWFDRALGNHDYSMFSIKFDPLLKNVRTDPRYQALLVKLNLI